MLKRRALNLISAFIIIILSWEVIADIVCAPFLPPPAAVLYNLCIDFIPKLWIHTLWSLIRIFSGIAVSVIIGMPAGLYMGYYKKLNRLLTPLLYLTYPVPKIALLPVVILLFGMGEISKIVMIVMIVLFQIIIALRDAALGIPKEAFYLGFSTNNPQFYWGD